MNGTREKSWWLTSAISAGFRVFRVISFFEG